MFAQTEEAKSICDVRLHFFTQRFYVDATSVNAFTGRLKRTSSLTTGHWVYKSYQLHDEGLQYREQDSTKEDVGVPGQRLQAIMHIKEFHFRMCQNYFRKQNDFIIIWNKYVTKVYLHLRFTIQLCVFSSKASIGFFSLIVNVIASDFDIER